MKADPRRVAAWIELLHGRSAGLAHVCGNGDWTGIRRDVGDVAGMVDYVIRRDNGNAQGTYLRATTLMPDAPSDSGKRAGAAWSQSLPGLWADIDIAGPGHKLRPNHPGMSDYNPSKAMQFPLPADESAARAIIDESGLLKPTLWVHSGGGLYPWWLLEEPESVADDPFALDASVKLSDGWQRAIEQAAHRLSLSYGNVGDLARVLRIPGTINRKDDLERPCQVVEHDGPRYTFEALVECLFAAQGRDLPPQPPVTPSPVTISRPVPGLPAAGPRPGSPLDAFETNTSWADILEPAGWSVHHVNAGTTYWTRPDKSSREGHSATTGHSADGHDRMWVFSTSAGLPVGQPMSKPYVWGLLNGHGDDMRIVAKVLVTAGFGTPLAASASHTVRLGPPPTLTPLNGHQFAPPQAQVAPSSVPAVVAGQLAPAPPPTPPMPTGGEQRPWHPQPVRPGEGTLLPPFPVHALPPAMRELVEQVAGNKQVDPTMPALFALSTISAVAAGKMGVYRDGDWKEPLSMYTCAVAESGERKSPTGRAVFGAVDRIERRMAVEHGRVVDAAVDELDRQRADVKHNPSAANRVEDKIIALEASRKRPPRIQLANDITPEAMTRSLASLGGHGAILDAEGTFMGSLSGRYSKGVPNPELMIKAYDGDTYTSDRISRDPDRIERPTLALGLAVQRVVIEDAMNNKLLIERGALARIMYGFPVSLVGSRMEANAAPYDSGPGRVWSILLEGIAEIPPVEGADGPALICLSPQALELHKRLTDAIELRLKPGRDLAAAGIKEWAHKHAGRVLRIAALLHLAAGYTTTSEVQLQAMESAVAIGEWAIEHARHAHRVDRESADEATTRQCTQVLDWIIRTRATSFTVRDACRGIRAQWVSTKSMADALDQLAELGWVRDEQYLDRSGRWRPRLAVTPYATQAANTATM